jgi:hypothetical protein
VAPNPQIQLAGEAFAIPASHHGYVCGASLSGKHAAEEIIYDLLSWQQRQKQEECRDRQQDGQYLADVTDNNTIDPACKRGTERVPREGIFTTLDLWVDDEGLRERWKRMSVHKGS